MRMNIFHNSNMEDNAMFEIDLADSIRIDKVEQCLVFLARSDQTTS